MFLIKEVISYSIAIIICFRRILSPCKREFFTTRNTLLSVSGRSEDEPLVDNDEEENKIEDKSNRFRHKKMFYSSL
jgi:hypothetical protein